MATAKQLIETLSLVISNLEKLESDTKIKQYMVDESGQVQAISLSKFTLLVEEGSDDYSKFETYEEVDGNDELNVGPIDVVFLKN